MKPAYDRNKRRQNKNRRINDVAKPGKFLLQLCGNKHPLISPSKVLRDRFLQRLTRTGHLSASRWLADISRIKPTRILQRFIIAEDINNNKTAEYQYFLEHRPLKSWLRKIRARVEMRHQIVSSGYPATKNKTTGALTEELQVILWTRIELVSQPYIDHMFAEARNMIQTRLLDPGPLDEMAIRYKYVTARMLCIWKSNHVHTINNDCATTKKKKEEESDPDNALFSAFQISLLDILKCPASSSFCPTCLLSNPPAAVSLSLSLLSATVHVNMLRPFDMFVRGFGDEHYRVLREEHLAGGKGLYADPFASVSTKSDVNGGGEERTHQNGGSKEAAVRSLEGPKTLPLTCISSACQCHQGASIFCRGISLPVALRLAGEHASILPHLFHLLLLKASVTHLSFLSFLPGRPPAALCRHRSRREGNHRGENGDHFAPVPRLAAATDDTSGRIIHRTLSKGGPSVAILRVGHMWQSDMWAKRGKSTCGPSVANLRVGQVYQPAECRNYSGEVKLPFPYMQSDIYESHCSPISSDHSANPLSELTRAENIVAISLACKEGEGKMGGGERGKKAKENMVKGEEEKEETAVGEVFVYPGKTPRNASRCKSTVSQGRRVELNYPLPQRRDQLIREIRDQIDDLLETTVMEAAVVLKKQKT
ncbi:uncharacterized protein V6R79_005570 [Siganus canaliculatus]